MKWSDLYTLATLLTLLRLGIGALWPLFPPEWRLWLYLGALLTDVLDGAVARWQGNATWAGAALDGWVDKILHVNLAWTLAVEDVIPDHWMILWFTRELIQAPMVPLLVGPFKRHHGQLPETSGWGRAAAVGLALAVIGCLLGYPSTALSWSVAVSGAAASGIYLRRHWHQMREA